MKGFILSTIASFALLSHAAPTDSVRHVLHEKRSTTPRRWQRGQRVHADAILPIKIGLAQNNLDNGYELLLDVIKSGDQWTAEQVHDHFGAADEVSSKGIPSEKTKLNFCRPLKVSETG